ncbi:MAG: flagellar basal body rod protein FlgC [Myxococcota bacterium]|nr:flagellar basal body rod protein FlgC [Myxococcota bacterium]
MILSDVTDIAVSGLDAQRVRMTVTASNLANMESSRADGSAYRRRDPVFRAEPLERGFAGALDRELRSVRVSRIVEDTRAPLRRYDPGHPDADAEGYRSVPRVNPVQEMTNLLSASRSFEANLLVMRHVRQIGEAALQIGR